MSRILCLLALALGFTMFQADRGHAQAGAPQTRALYLQLIHQARADGRPRAAIAYLDDFERHYAGDIDARLLRANCLLDLGQVDQAERVVATLDRSSGTAGLSAARGNVFAARGRWAEAVPHYREAAAANPAEPLLKNALGYALLRTRNIAGAIEQLRSAADIAPTNEIVRNNLALALMLSGNMAASEQLLANVSDRQARGRLLQQIAEEAARLNEKRGS